MFVFGIMSSNVAEYCIQNGYLRKITVRRIGGVMIGTGTLYLIMLGFLPCREVEKYIVPMLILSSFRAGLWISIAPSAIDISPTYQDTLVAANTVASFIPGFLVPLVISRVGKDTREQWRKIFLVSVAVVNASIGFYLLASTDRVLSFDEAALKTEEESAEKKLSRSEYASESKSFSTRYFDPDGAVALRLRKKWIVDDDNITWSIWDMEEPAIVQYILDQVNEDIKSQRPSLEEAFPEDGKTATERGEDKKEKEKGSVKKKTQKSKKKKHSKSEKKSRKDSKKEEKDGKKEEERGK